MGWTQSWPADDRYCLNCGRDGVELFWLTAGYFCRACYEQYDPQTGRRREEAPVRVKR